MVSFHSLEHVDIISLTSLVSRTPQRTMGPGSKCRSNLSTTPQVMERSGTILTADPFSPPIT